MDGFPRAFAETLRLLFSRGKPERVGRRAYWIFLLSIYALAVAFLTFLPRPVLLVTAAAALSLLFAPLYYVLNYYCVTRLMRDEEYRPGRPARALALAGIVFVTAGAVLFLYTEIYLRLMSG
jgi:Mn2+/Fe2+ NRAMP family transporter